jgi:hypothetical protein
MPPAPPTNQLPSSHSPTPARSLYYLKLADNQIRDDGARAIAETLKNNISLGQLDLSNCNIGGDGGGYIGAPARPLLTHAHSPPPPYSCPAHLAPPLPHCRLAALLLPGMGISWRACCPNSGLISTSPPPPHTQIFTNKRTNLGQLCQAATNRPAGLPSRLQVLR